MDNNNWKFWFQLDSRQKNVDTIMDSLKRYRPSSQDEINEFERAKVFEEIIFTAATSQLDYEHKIWMKILTIETKPQKHSHPGSLNTQFQVQYQTQTNSQSQMLRSQQNVIDQVFGQTSGSGSTLQNQYVIDQQKQIYQDQRAHADTLSKSRNANKDLQEEEVYQKIKHLNDQYLPELSETHQEICDAVKKHPESTQLQTLKADINVSKSNILPQCKGEFPNFEEGVIKIIDKYRPVSQILEPQLSSSTEKPIDRLIKAVNSVQPEALIAAVNDIASVMRLMDKISESGPSDMSLNATSRFKRPKLLQANSALSEEIREINQYLIDTVVDISEDESLSDEGTVVKCTFIGIAFSPSLKSLYDWAQMSSILSLKLLVPTDYPNRSPVMSDKLPPEVSKEHKDLWVMMNLEFSAFLKSFSQPMSLREIATKWDICARAVISDLSSFSSKQWDFEFFASD